MCKKFNPHVKVASIRPIPFGHHAITLYTPDVVDLNGWNIRDASGNLFPLHGSLRVGQGQKFHINKSVFSLQHRINALYLVNKTGNDVHNITYRRRHLKPDQHLTFPVSSFTHNDDAAQISAIIPDAEQNLIITIKALFVPPVHLTGWTLKNNEDESFYFKGHLQPGTTKSIQLKDGSFKINKEGDQLRLIDPFNSVIHRLDYDKKEAKRGKPVEFVPTQVQNVPIMMAAPIISKIDRDNQSRVIVTVEVRGESCDLTGYTLLDSYMNRQDIDDSVLKAGRKKQFLMGTTKGSLDDAGYSVALINAKGKIIHCISQTKFETGKGVFIGQGGGKHGMNTTSSFSNSAPWDSFYDPEDFQQKKEKLGFRKRFCSLFCLKQCFCCCTCCCYSKSPKQGSQSNPPIWVSSIQPEGNKQKITICTSCKDGVDLDGWKLIDDVGHLFELEGSVRQDQPRTIYVTSDTFSLSKHNDKLSLMNVSDVIVHTVMFSSPGGLIHGFGSYKGTLRGSGILGKSAIVVISSIMIADSERKEEQPISVTLLVNGDKKVDVTGWQIWNDSKQFFTLQGLIEPGQNKTFTATTEKFLLGNNGGKVSLHDDSENLVSIVRYRAKDAKKNTMLYFNNAGKILVRTPVVSIASVLPVHMGVSDVMWEFVTLKINTSAIDLLGWKLTDHNGYALDLDGSMKENQRITVSMKKDATSIKSEQNQLQLTNMSGSIIHMVTYNRQDIINGVAIDFRKTIIGTPTVGEVRTPTVLISSIIPSADPSYGSGSIIKIKTAGGDADLKGYKLMKINSEAYTFGDCSIEAWREKTFFINSTAFSMSSNGDVLLLMDKDGQEVHRVSYTKEDVKQGSSIGFGYNVKNPMRGQMLVSTVQVSSIMNNPLKNNPSQRLITLKVTGSSTELENWYVVDSSGFRSPLEGGILEEGASKSFIITGKDNNYDTGSDNISLYDANGNMTDCVHFEKEENVSGLMIDFHTIKNSILTGKARIPTVLITSLLLSSSENTSGNASIVLKVEGSEADLSGYMMRNQSGQSFKFENCVIAVDTEKMFFIETGEMTFNRNGDVIRLFDKNGFEVHCVRYMATEVYNGVWIDFGMYMKNTFVGVARVPRVNIISMIHPSLRKASKQLMITLQAKHLNIEIDHWKINDAYGQSCTLYGTLKDGRLRSFLLDVDHLNEKNDFTLIDGDGNIIDSVGFDGEDMFSGVMIDFRTRKENSSRGKPRVFELSQGLFDNEEIFTDVVLPHAVVVETKRISRRSKQTVQLQGI